MFERMGYSDSMFRSDDAEVEKMQRWERNKNEKSEFLVMKREGLCGKQVW